jgi:DNA-binding Xre family transcriptional regulator
MLREIAEPLGWNPQSLAVETQLAYTTIQPIWSNEAQQVDLQTLDKLSLVLRVPPSMLIGNGEQAQEKPVPTRSMLGICADLGVTLTGEQIDTARQEMWGKFYQ